ncbi:MAG: Na(+)/H(+) antiporter subunit B [Nisaea sp.]|jgi:multicomponent Na+:H+ antiporter subunit B|uniref:Na(+)/H(+) antiporter subunit B n=1 Tax=Nisaea sp. TaxID=2024842 RepID=UPI001B10BB0C|nr:Na(+)/H(+) antiporter subunit B [Nisaea sp.]MBO6558896.1 Na(+)/H(+) antiporter subunit B [Nisaea sp.]
MRHHLILRVVSKLLIPFILLYALYVQFHGDYGPGGGFQAGVIFGAAFVLYALIYGVETAQKAFPASWLAILVPLGLLIFGGTGVASLLLGGTYLDYDVLAATPTGGQHLGIIVVEFGVGVTVTGVIIAIFFAYAGRTDDIQDDDW